MRWVIVFENKPGVDQMLKAAHDAHLAFLKAHPEIMLAGSATDAETTVRYGGYG